METGEVVTWYWGFQGAGGGVEDLTVRNSELGCGCFCFWLCMMLLRPIRGGKVLSATNDGHPHSAPPLDPAVVSGQYDISVFHTETPHIVSDLHADNAGEW